MAVSLTQFITALAAKAGIQSTDTILIDVLSKAELQNTSVPDELVTAIDTNLFNVQSAKNNLELKKHFSAPALNGIDSEIRKVMEELGLDDESKAELMSEDVTTFKKVGLLAHKIKALEEKKASAAIKDKPELAQKINDLQRQVADTIKAGEAKIQEIQAQHQSELTGMSVKQILAAQKYAANQLPQDVNITVSNITVDKNLAADGAKFVMRNGVLKMVQAKDESLDYQDKNGNQPSPEQYIQGVLAQNKLLAVSEPTPPVGIPGTPNGQPTHSPGNPGAAPKTNHDAAYEQAERDFAMGSHTPSVVSA